MVYLADLKFQCILCCETFIKPIQIFEPNTVAYRMSSSPLLSIHIIHQLVDDKKDDFPLAAVIFANDAYLEDLFVGRVDKSFTLALRD